MVWSATFTSGTILGTEDTEEVLTTARCQPWGLEWQGPGPSLFWLMSSPMSKVARQLKLTFNSGSSCLQLPSAGITC